MPLQNRVDPFGLIHATPERGLMMGNRGGCFHDDNRSLKRTHWKTRQWITCVLEFKDRKRSLMTPNLYTELFFLDEATSLAAGHRPCYECRYQAAVRFRAALMRADAFSRRPRAGDLDDAIAGEMQDVLRGKTARQTVKVLDLPDGAMFTTGADAFLKWRGLGFRWSFAGYDDATDLPAQALRLTPRLTCLALDNGYVPDIHPSVGV